MNNEIGLLKNKITALYDENKITNNDFNFIMKKISQIDREFDELNSKSTKKRLEDYEEKLWDIYSGLCDFFGDSDDEDGEDE